MTDNRMPELIPFAKWVDTALANPGPKWLLPGFIPAQGMVMLVGRPKLSKKSWLAYIMAMCAASGKHVGPFKPSHKMNVLFYSREGAENPIAQRIPAIERGMGLSRYECTGMFWGQNESVLLDEPVHQNKICKEVREKEIELVIIDTFARSFTGDENSAREVGKALRGVEKIRDSGAATLLVHHLSKQRIPLIGGIPDIDAGLRGSSALAGAYDNMISIQDHEQDNEKIQWMHVGGKYLDQCAYLPTWTIQSDSQHGLVSAQLVLDGPQPPPVLEEPREIKERIRF